MNENSREIQDISFSTKIKIGDKIAYSPEYHSHLLSKDDFEDTDDYILNLRDEESYLFVRNGFLINHLTKEMVEYWNSKNVDIVTIPQTKDDKRVILDIEGCTRYISFLEYDKFEKFQFDFGDLKDPVDFDYQELHERAYDIKLDSLCKE